MDIPIKTQLDREQQIALANNLRGMLASPGWSFLKGRIDEMRTDLADVRQALAAVDSTKYSAEAVLIGRCTALKVLDEIIGSIEAEVAKAEQDEAERDGNTPVEKYT